MNAKNLSSIENPAQKSVETVLAVIFVAWVWFVPNHQLPWASFHHELWMGLVLVLAALLVGWQTKYRFDVPAAALLFLVLAFLPMLQWRLGVQPKWGQAAVASTYLLAVGISVVLGYVARINQSTRLIEILFGAILVAGLFNVPIQIIQWMQWYQQDFNSFIGFFVTPIPDVARPSGNLLQPNQLATLLVWGLLVLIWLLMKSKSRWPLLVPGVLITLAGLALTQSRTGFVEVLIASAAILWWSWKNKRWDVGFFAVVIPVLLTAFSLGIGQLADSIGALGVSAPRLETSDGGRLEAYMLFLKAAFERPWLGFGIGDVGFAYVMLADQNADLYPGIRFLHSHNAVIDLVLWVGFPVAIALLILAARWVWNALKADLCLPDVLIPFLMLAAFGFHSMVELPHHYLYFLAPVGILVGWLSWRDDGRVPVLSAGRGWWLISSALGLIVISCMVYDYSRLQKIYTDWRYEQKKVGQVVRDPIPVPLMLNQISDELILYRTRFQESPDIDALKFVNETAMATPTPPAFFAAAVANGLAGNSIAARQWMARLNAVVPLPNYKQAVAAWREEQERHSILKNLSWPEYRSSPDN